MNEQEKEKLIETYSNGTEPLHLAWRNGRAYGKWQVIDKIKKMVETVTDLETKNLILSLLLVEEVMNQEEMVKMIGDIDNLGPRL